MARHQDECPARKLFTLDTSIYICDIEREDNPTEKLVEKKLVEIEDLRVKMVNPGQTVDGNTLRSCFVSALPSPEYDLEIRGVKLEQFYDRKKDLELGS